MYTFHNRELERLHLEASLNTVGMRGVQKKGNHSHHSEMESQGNIVFILHIYYAISRLLRPEMSRHKEYLQTGTQIHNGQ